METTIDRALLDEDEWDESVVWPSLRKLLVLATQDTDQQVEAVIGISKVVERDSVDLPSFGPLCQTLTRLVASEHQPVVAYAARSIKALVLDDTLRPQAIRAGIPSVLAAALIKWRGDTACLREMLGALQALCYDERTVLEVVDTGALGRVLELLTTNDLELRLVSMATLTNILSFSDTLLLSRERECINAVRDRMDVVVDAIESQYGIALALAALANGCAHRVLAARAKEVGAPDLLMTKLLVANTTGEHRLMQMAMARLNGHEDGDVEEGGCDGHEASVFSHPVQFLRVKSGTDVRLQTKMTALEVVFWTTLFAVPIFLVVAVLVQDWYP